MDAETVEVRTAGRGPRPLGTIAATVTAALIISTALIAPRASVCDVRAFAPGSGDGRSVQTPLLVHDEDALDAVRGCLDRHHLQVTDILPNAPFVPLGLTSGSTMGLSGSYDGGDRSIVDLRIFLPGVDGVALFASIDGGSVSDLTLLRPRVEGRSAVAALVGIITAGAIVQGVSLIDASIVAADVAGVVAGVSSDDVVMDVRIRGGDVQVAGYVVGTHVGRIRADTIDPAAAPAEALSTAIPIAGSRGATDVGLRDADGPTAQRAVGAVHGAG